jgi:hypothetical protein
MSEKPLLLRLQLKAGRRLAVLYAPADRQALFASAEPAAIEDAEVALAFAGTREEMAARLAALKDRTRADAILWLGYAKKTSPRAGEIHRDLIHDFARGHGLDAVAQIALDTDYSALRFKRLP